MNSPSSTTPRDKTSDFGLRTSDFLLVTPVLDGWPRIRAAVASVAAQDAPGLRIRHIVQLSDRSKDPSGAWLRELPGVEVHTETDTGLYDAIARGFQEGLAAWDGIANQKTGNGQRATGNEKPDPILSWLNSDEQMLPGTLARVAEEFRRHPETDVVFGDYLLLDADGRPTAWRREIPANPWLLRNGVNSILSCATFFRRRVWETLGGFDSAFSLVADKDFYLRALAAGFHFRHIRAPLGAYANTGDNATLRHPLLALREQARLREKAGAHGPATRKLARLLRCLSKFVHGCYGRRRLETTLFNSEGGSTSVRIRLGTRWEDPADEVARRRIYPSPLRRFAFAVVGWAAAVVRVLRGCARSTPPGASRHPPLGGGQDEEKAPLRGKCPKDFLSGSAPLREGECSKHLPESAPLREGGCPKGAGGSTPCGRFATSLGFRPSNRNLDLLRPGMPDGVFNEVRHRLADELLVTRDGAGIHALEPQLYARRLCPRSETLHGLFRNIGEVRLRPRKRNILLPYPFQPRQGKDSLRQPVEPCALPLQQPQ